jgi:hypothetical protein
VGTSRPELWPDHDFDNYSLHDWVFLDYDWYATSQPSSYVINESPEILDLLLENGTKYNNYAGYTTPTKTECDLLYFEKWGIDYATDTQATYWSGAMTQPKNFATGATNFTSDKWPVWMTGFRNTPISTPALQEFLAPTTDRPLGASQNITSNPWTSEPFGWPTASWYQDGTY